MGYGNHGVISIFELMDKETKRRNVKPEPFEFVIDVEYLPFPSEEKRREAYYTHAKLFLMAKERELREQVTMR